MSGKHHVSPKALPPLSDLTRAEKVYKESEQVREETKQILAECRATLEQTQRFNDQANKNQRRIAYAVSSLLPKSARHSFNLDETDIDNTAQVARENVEAISKRELFDIVHAINVLAMANTDVINIYTEYTPTNNAFLVQAYELRNGVAGVVLNEEVELIESDTLEKLISIESQITELIIEAREQAEAKAKEYQPKQCIHGAILYGKCKKCAEAEKGGEA